MDKLGTDPEHSIIYITGLSGSGKTTYANAFASLNQKIVIFHLDDYAYILGDDWNKIYDFRFSLMDYAKWVYSQEGYIIVEGFQIANEWLKPIEEYSDACVLIPRTSFLKCFIRTIKRDRIRLSELPKSFVWFIGTWFQVKSFERYLKIERFKRKLKGV